jgi:hypothetical protein
LRLGGGLAAAGLTLPALPRLQAAGTGEPAAGRGARSCILVYLLGGPPHQDMFDLKADAPAEIRGEFNPIATKVPGLQICELLPKLADLAGKYALIRSITQRNSNHTPMIYYTLTGRHAARPDQDNDTRPPQRADFPHLGSVLARFKTAPAALPGFIAIPELAVRSSTSGMYQRIRTALRGGGAGFLGPRWEPLCVNGEPGAPDAVPALALPSDVTAERFERRAALLALLDHGRRSSGSIQTAAGVREQAVLLTGAASRSGLAPFSLEGEPESVRDRYGRHRFGQAMLLARRLAEAGVPMIAIHFNEMTVCDGWDTHSQNFAALKMELLPMLDQSLSALLADLDERGLLDETVVACLGEFGRTPKINANAGRDHWGECSTALLAGGGIRGGQVLGASDRYAAWPISDPVEPADIQATLYHCLGLDPRQPIYDELQRPFPISEGKVLRQLL